MPCLEKWNFMNLFGLLFDLEVKNVFFILFLQLLKLNRGPIFSIHKCALIHVWWGSYTLVMFVCACAAALSLFSAQEQLPTGSWRCCDWSKCVRCSCTDPCVTATPVQWPGVDWVISHVNCVQITPERWGGRGGARRSVIWAGNCVFLTLIWMTHKVLLSLTLSPCYKKSVRCENIHAHRHAHKRGATCCGWTTVGI